MNYIEPNHPTANAVTEAIQSGNTAELSRLLAADPQLVKTRIGEKSASRSLLHIATDWPGHFTNVGETIRILAEAGCDINARFEGFHTETPLHWAASSDDIEALDTLLDLGADIEAKGGVIAGGTPLTDSRAFKQWNVAFRLVERGAEVTLIDAATLGLMDHLTSYFQKSPEPTSEEITSAFWGACHGGRQEAAEYLFEKGADINWIAPWEPLTPLDAAERNGSLELVKWLQERGGKRARELNIA